MPGHAAGRVCRVAGCESLAVKGAWLCTEHLDGRVRCSKMLTEVAADGTEYTRQCKNAAMRGTTTCKRHSGKKSRDVAIRAEAESAMRKFVTPYEGDIDPITMFEVEFRRTFGRITWLEDQIGRLGDGELIFGVTKVEEVRATEFTGTNTTSEARIHQYEEMLRWERKHLLDLEKLWIGAKLDQQKLNLMRDTITYTYTKVIEVARMLGHDPESDETREILARLFAEGAQRGDDRVSKPAIAG